MIKPRAFKAKDGRRVLLRSVKWEDLNDLMELINSMTEEKADILRTEKVTRQEEAEWLGRRLARIEKHELIDAVAEVDGKVVANSEVEKKDGLMSHVGYLGIGIRSGYRSIGIGAELMKALIEESKREGLKMLVLDHFATNKTARLLYEKMGFRETGRTPKAICKNAKYVDLIHMIREL